MADLPQNPAPKTPIQNLIVENLQAPNPEQTARTVKFIGQLDESNIDLNSKTIYDLITQNPKKLFLLLDFSKLEYMNSKSIGYLTDWYTKITEGQGKVVIASAPASIIDILQAVGIIEMIKNYPSFEEAKNNLFA
jgi:anti-anti-sigma factor